MVVKDTSYVHITYNVDSEILLICWKQVPTMQQLKESYMAALEFVECAGNIKSYCTDLSAVGSLNREQEAWLILDFYPKVYQLLSSSINAAVVFSEDHFKAIVTNYQQPAYFSKQNFINFNYFTDLQEALDWLRSIKKGQDTYSAMPS